MLDALSDVLRVIRLSGGVFLEAELTAPWCISGRISADDCKPFLAAPRHVIASHFVAAGHMQLRIDDGATLDVRAGELILLPRNDVHTFGSDLSIAPMSAREVIQPPEVGGISRIKYGGGGETTQLLCGFLGSETPFSPLLSSLPSLLKLDVRTTASGAWIESSFRFAVSEIAAGRVGSATVIAKLSELLFVEAVSQYVANLPAERRGWLAGLRDPHIGRALALLHARPTEGWTAEALALEVGMSRSVFAERFTALVGQPPMQYLTLWRMHVAAQHLREGRGNVAQIGFAVGYESEAAFSRAFKRQFGTSPGTWRRQSA
ncbi:AraC-like DNA-binding protein [Pseudomonas sp. 478]|uniref:AraC family transcriptional regulator n=1 Tax=unclassified Pseudomonas TaxID=196821 RepID=UPI000DAC947E|nr:MULTISPECIES: AraC family transcriptional regulator [unclassified Pseudomonas]PZX00684.1 AraC-like DNA-binding protein [Pseudomonas sp. 478]TCV56326.1 AraC family transcriptional regulator [Pseudomonas sp. 460]